MPVEVPQAFECPICLEILHDPVICADGHTYDRTCIEDWFAHGNATSPRTNCPLPHKTLLPNLTVQQAIAEYVEQHQAELAGAAEQGRGQKEMRAGDGGPASVHEEEQPYVTAGEGQVHENGDRHGAGVGDGQGGDGEGERGGLAFGRGWQRLTRVECEHGGGLPGTRVWRVAGYDGDKCVCLVDRDYGAVGNQQKFNDFVQGLQQRGYVLDEGQRETVHRKLMLDVISFGVPASVPRLLASPLRSLFSF